MPLAKKRKQQQKLKYAASELASAGLPFDKYRKKKIRNAAFSTIFIPSA